MYDLIRFVGDVRKSLERHNLGRPGAYQRWLWQNEGSTRELGINEYGCADAANIYYTINYFPTDLQERQAWVTEMQNLQDQKTGMFREVTHHPIHTTAHVTAALNLFDAQPLYPVHELAYLRDTGELAKFMDSLDWKGTPWSESHKGAGLYVSLVLTDAVDVNWEDAYFQWLWDETDAKTGMFRQGTVGPTYHHNVQSLFPHLAGTFHYLFNHQYGKRPLRYPERLVDTCLEIFADRSFPLGEAINFAEIDWVYCLNRAYRQSGYRPQESLQALRAFADRFMNYLLSVDTEKDDQFNDLHSLFGAMCCVAELQQALPGLIRTPKPTRLVLDRRPFI